jgi:hypothetical protein
MRAGSFWFWLVAYLLVAAFPASKTVTASSGAETQAGDWRDRAFELGGSMSAAFFSDYSQVQICPRIAWFALPRLGLELSPSMIASYPKNGTKSATLSPRGSVLLTLLRQANVSAFALGGGGTSLVVEKDHSKNHPLFLAGAGVRFHASPSLAWRLEYNHQWWSYGGSYHGWGSLLLGMSCFL